MRKIFFIICISLFTVAFPTVAQTGGFQQITVITGISRFLPSAQTYGPGTGIRLSGGFYPVKNLFINFGIGGTWMQQPLDLDYGIVAPPPPEVKERLFMQSTMVGAGVCIGNRKVHAMLGADGCVNILVPHKNNDYTPRSERAVGGAIRPHVDASFRISRGVLLGISGEAMFFSGYDKNDKTLSGKYFGIGIHAQLAH